MELTQQHIEELEDAISIDLSQLDDEVINHPDAFFAVSRAYTEAAADRDQAKDALNQIRSATEIEVRRRFAQNGEKATEGRIESEVEINEDVVEAQDDFRDKQLKASRLGDLKDAWNQRSHALSDLVRLYCANYFSDRASTITE